MDYQAERLGLIVDLAEQSMDIVQRFSNDPIDAGNIQTASGPIKNLKQVSADIKVDGQSAIDVAVTELMDTLKAETSVSALIDGLTDSAALAEESAARAVVAADSATAAGKIYDSTALGLAATVSGGYFSVPSTESSEYLILYKNSAGVASKIKSYPSAAAIEAKVQEVVVANKSVPIVADAAGNVAIWLADGKLEAKGVGPTILEDMGLIDFNPFETPLIPVLMDDEEKVAIWLDEGRLDAFGLGPNLQSEIGLAKFEPHEASRIPVLMDDDDNVALWLDGGEIDAVGLGPNLRSDIGLAKFKPHEPSRVPVLVDDQDNVALWLDEGKIDAKGVGPGIKSGVEVIVKAAIEAQPVDLSQLLTTTGKALWLYKAKKALLNNEAPAQLKVMFTGDSWSDLDTIPNKMAELLDADYPKIGYGWISALLNRMTNGVTASRTGWTLYDSSATPLAPEFGCAFDGGSITTMLATATVNISNLTATKLVIYYRGGPGTFRYRVDNGSWVTALHGTEGVREKIVIDGLANTPHVLDIDTLGNTSSVTLYGFYATSEASGYEILKCGRGGLRGGYAVKMLPYIADYAADLQADLLIISLGTNDYRSGDVQGYVDGLTGMIAKHREGRPDVGIIIVAPPDSNGVPAVPLTLIRDHGQKIARDTGCEFADIHSIFPLYAKSNALGLWADDLHLNAHGADMLCRHIYNHLMK